MPIRHEDIRTQRQWRAATGLTEEQFRDLHVRFAHAFEELFDATLAERQGDSSQAPVFTTYAELLFFGLYSLKSGLTYDLLALSFGLSISRAHAIQATVLAVLRAALTRGGYMPKREYATVAEFVADWQAEGAIMLDATEHRRQRPGNQDVQKETYSGKKKPTP